MLESELFGYEKGAFTGADSRKIGLFEAADGGTLFLDEIGEMGINMQKKLLRVLQEGEFRRVGGREALRVNVRIVSATNADLNKMISEGTFREDFYYRIKVMTIRVPTLRERREDIPALAEFFMDRLAEETGVRKKIEPEALRMLMAHSWPGNVRELENETRRLHAICRGDITAQSVGAFRSSPGGGAGVASGDPFEGRTLEEIEKEAILLALKRAGGNKARAAKNLCIPRRTLYNRLKKYGIGLNGSD